MKDLATFEKFIKTGKPIEPNTPEFEILHTLSARAQKWTCKLNSKYHCTIKKQQIFAKLTNQPINTTLTIFTPFYTDCGCNIHIGKNVFINACCNFQDQGGIYIGNNVLVGHQVVLATLNHELEPSKRATVIPKPINIHDNVWIGSHATILCGVTIGKNSVVAAGAVVTKDVAENTIVGGIPAKIIKHI